MLKQNRHSYGSSSIIESRSTNSNSTRSTCTTFGSTLTNTQHISKEEREEMTEDVKQEGAVNNIADAHQMKMA